MRTPLKACKMLNAVYAGDRQAAYAFLYPNVMINRYGPWMDTNIVMPEGPDSCTVRFDWWLEDHLCHDKALIEQSIADSEQVSMYSLPFNIALTKCGIPYQGAACMHSGLHV